MRRVSPLRAGIVAMVVIAAGSVGARQAAPTADVFADLTWRCIGPFDGGPVSVVVGVPGEPGTYTIATPGGSIWRTHDGGETWTAAEDGRLPPAGEDPLTWTDPANPSRIVNGGPQGIAVTLDRGRTWTTWHNQPIAQVDRVATSPGVLYWVWATERDGHRIAIPSRRDLIAGDPVSPIELPTSDVARVQSIAGHHVNVVRADPARDGLLFAGTDESVYVSFDRGAAWQSLRLNLPSAPIRDLAVHENDLVAATDGRSVWVLDDISPLRQITPATAGSAAVLFAPAPAVRIRPGPDSDVPFGATIDYYLARVPAHDVTLRIADAAGRVVYTATSAARPSADPWQPLVRPLATTAGHHRFVWDLHADAPPTQRRRFARLAPALFEDSPPDPSGPLVLPGLYRVTLTVAGQTYAQPLRVRTDPRVSESADRLAQWRAQFDLARKVCDAMRLTHAQFVEVTKLRAELTPDRRADDAGLAQAASDLDDRLAALDGSGWNPLVLPDADSDTDEEIDKDIEEDAKPPVPVALTKDYDDPTMIVGRAFTNTDHAPAFAIVDEALARLLTRIEAVDAAPDAGETAEYHRQCEQLSTVLADWRTVVARDLVSFNRERARRQRPALVAAPPASAGLVCK